MKKLLTLLLALLLGASCVACAGNAAQTPSEPSEDSSEPEAEVSVPAPEPEPTYNVPVHPVDVYKAFTEQTITRKNGSTASFRLFVPDGYVEGAKYPVVLFLHGAGERGNDNRAQLINATQNFYDDLNSPVYGAIFIVPQCPLNKQWVASSWTPGKYSLANTPETDENQMALEILQWVEENYTVDTARRYVMGISMGGFGAWDLLLRHNELFAGAVIMCGGGGDPSCAETVLDTPIYLVHSKDDTAVAYNGAQEMADAIRSRGGNKLIFQSLNGFGHGVWNYTSQNMLVARWLFSQSRAD